ncbi:MAG: allantoinase, partial [Thermoplasmata archaeon]
AREPSENTLEILNEFGNFIYDSDAYNDDLPYFYQKTGMLIIPYTPDVNDFHFLSPMHRFANSDDFFNYMKDTFNVLYKESKISPKLMNVGLHVRISGRPGRFVAIEKFIKYVKKYDIWIATREEIARFWIKNFKQ